MDENLKAPQTEQDSSSLLGSITETIHNTEIGAIEEEEILPEVDVNAVYKEVDIPPSFPGGEAAIFQQIAKTMRYPLMAQERNIQGRVVVGFVIDRDGSLIDVKIVQSVDSDLDKEAIRVIRSLPRFNPGKIRGTPVKTSMSLPVTFKLQ